MTGLSIVAEGRLGLGSYDYESVSSMFSSVSLSYCLRMTTLAQRIQYC